jgi:hypothetical protein
LLSLKSTFTGPVKSGPLGVMTGGVAVDVLAGGLDGVFATGVLAVAVGAVVLGTGVLGTDSGVAALRLACGPCR